MGGLFHRPKVVQPAPPPPVPTGPTEEEKAAALAEEKTQERKRRGRGSTIVTGGLGLTNKAPVSRKVLLGQ